MTFCSSCDHLFFSVNLVIRIFSSCTLQAFSALFQLQPHFFISTSVFRNSSWVLVLMLLRNLLLLLLVLGLRLELIVSLSLLVGLFTIYCFFCFCFLELALFYSWKFF